MKRIILIIVSFFAVISFPKALQMPVELESESATVMHFETKYIMYEKESNKKQIMASLTKIMTTYTALNLITNLDEQITITEEDLFNLDGYACIGLKVGDIVTYKDLLYGTMLKSGADASQALANHITNQKDFINQMNNNAKKLNLINTTFVDSYGRSDENVSTSNEIAMLLNEALKNDLFKEIFTSNNYTLTNGITIENKLKNTITNLGLNSNYIRGTKPGYTNNAGLLLASLSTINGIDYIIITCKTHKEHAQIFDTYKIIEYLKKGNYEERTLFKKGDTIKSIDVDNSSISEYVVTINEDVKKVLSDEEYKNIKYDYHITNIITPDNKIDDDLGYMNILINDEIIYTYNVTLNHKINEYKEGSKVIYILIVILIILAIIILCTNILSKNKIQKKR